ncbi:hypothetical protein ACP70R_017945 [Stipagrostis hirtigluma subsp. patula]
MTSVGGSGERREGTDGTAPRPPPPPWPGAAFLRSPPKSWEWKPRSSVAAPEDDGDGDDLS